MNARAITKRYTANQMRDVAQCLHYNSPTKLTIEAASMLRQAAEMRERIDELLLTFHSCPDERNLLNYILRGDAGKEEDK